MSSNGAGDGERRGPQHPAAFRQRRTPASEISPSFLRLTSPAIPPSTSTRLRASLRGGTGHPPCWFPARPAECETWVLLPSWCCLTETRRDDPSLSPTAKALHS